MYILKGILYFPWRPTNICVVKISPTKILLSNVHLGRMQVSWRLDNDCSFLVLAITAGPGKIHYHRKDNYDFRAVSLFGVLFKRSVSQHSFIYPPPSTGGWIDVTLATLYSYTHLTYIHVRPYLNMCLFTYSVFPFISEQKLVHEIPGSWTRWRESTLGAQQARIDPPSTIWDGGSTVPCYNQIESI